MIRIAGIELTKYVRAYVIIIICFLLLEIIFVTHVEAKNSFEYGTFDLDTFKIVNSVFTSLITSAMPLTIILNICNEFKNGYALKLMSNGLSRTSYCKAKFTLAGALAFISMLLYLLIILFLLSIQRTTYFDQTIFVSSLIQIVIFSMFFSTIAVSLSFLMRSWQYALLTYYVYTIIETFVVLRFEQTAPWVKYLPFHLVISIFQLQAVPENIKDYLLPGGIVISFCLVVVWCCLHFFKKADL